MTKHTIAPRLLRWFDQHGRKDLPWQHNTSPYRVWVSEIMLQQTQVKTVIPYYQRFMATFPNVGVLADTAEDQVLHLWTGLGYYARARNLHRAAKIVASEFNGEFPSSQAALEALPGIGRSTAGAILAIAFRQPASILDGNVKRVLARYHVVDGWYGQSTTLQQLWELAERHTPAKRVADYTQAIMDLGATVCTRSKPACGACPLQSDCRARESSTTHIYPNKKAGKKIPLRQTRMLVLINPSGEVLLEKRPPSGIWGSLWSLPQLALDKDPAAWVTDITSSSIIAQHDMAPLRHTFSHFQLDITATIFKLAAQPTTVAEGDRVWYNIRQPDARGLAAPVKALLEQIASDNAP